jgi:hypothetical protein
MPRRLRIEFEGAIYHVMARGNARQKIVRDDADRRRLIDGLVVRPEDYEWSSYPGFRDARRRQSWVAHDALLAAWRGDRGTAGQDAATAYIRFLEAGLDTPPSSPFREAFGGWILGSRPTGQAPPHMGYFNVNARGWRAPKRFA